MISFMLCVVLATAVSVDATSSCVAYPTIYEVLSETNPEIKLTTSCYPTPLTTLSIDCYWFIQSDVPRMQVDCEVTFETKNDDCFSNFLYISYADGYKDICSVGTYSYTIDTSNSIAIYYLTESSINNSENYHMTCTVKRIVPDSSTAQPPLKTCDGGCGKIAKSKIVNGNKVEDNHYWMVLVLKNLAHQCGGSILNENYVLTAAHCLSGPATQYAIKAGILSQGETGQVVKAIKYVIHENYDSQNVDNDIAILELENSLTFGDEQKVGPVCMPYGDQFAALDTSTAQVNVIGWGTTSSSGPTSQDLLEVALNCVPSADCNIPYEGQITNNMLCAQDTGKDSCQGDSGGPLFAKEGDVATQVGIVSWGNGCAKPNYPGVYTKLTNYLTNWLEAKTGTLFCKAPEPTLFK